MSTQNNEVTRYLYGYWRSSASYRVRIALNIKGLPYQHRAIHLVNNEQNSDDFLQLNPQGLIPLYVEDDNNSLFSLPQSLAILDYLEERYPERALLPRDIQRKAQIKSIAQIIACEIHPLDNLRVLQYLENTLDVANDKKMEWYRHWIAQGFQAIEKQLPDLLNGQPFSMGEQPGYLESVIIPQLYNAKRFNCPLRDYPNLIALDTSCAHHTAFSNAAPENQPDAQ